MKCPPQAHRFELPSWWHCLERLGRNTLWRKWASVGRLYPTFILVHPLLPDCGFQCDHSAPVPPSMPFLPVLLLYHHDTQLPSKTVRQNSSSLLKLVLLWYFVTVMRMQLTYKGDAISFSYFPQLFLFVFSSTEVPITPFLSSLLSSMLGIKLRASHAKQTLYNCATPLSLCFGKLLTWC